MKNLILKINNHLATVTLNRPEIRNAFNSEMIKELTETFSQLGHRSDIRAICLSGEGKAFCAGGDLNWMKEMVEFSNEENLADARQLFEMFEAIHFCNIPIIGKVHGSVFGGGLGLLAGCDFVVADSKTQFCFSEVKIGIAPAVISPFILRKIDRAQVAPWMISGRIFGVDVALRMGLIHQVGEEDTLNDQVDMALAWFNDVGPAACRATKRLIAKLPELDWNEKKEASTELIAELRVSKEGQEGLRAFLSKTKPSWRAT